MPRLILASTSPRRRELLAVFGLPFDVIGSDFDEDSISSTDYDPGEWVVQLAVGKARTVASQTLGDAFVIGADTTVVLDGECLGKPSYPPHAIQMLRQLSGRTHQVYTGITIIPVQNGVIGAPLSDFAVTDVTFDPIPDDIIAAYVATGEPLDKAGAYGIQGKALAFIPRINGDYFNVVGLPLNRLCALLGQFGISVW